MYIRDRLTDRWTNYKYKYHDVSLTDKPMLVARKGQMKRKFISKMAMCLKSTNIDCTLTSIVNIPIQLENLTN